MKGCFFPYTQRLGVSYPIMLKAPGGKHDVSEKKGTNLLMCFQAIVSPLWFSLTVFVVWFSERFIWIFMNFVESSALTMIGPYYKYFRSRVCLSVNYYEGCL